MKEILSGERSYYKIQNIKWVTVPNFDECCPKKIIESKNLKQQKEILQYCPEVYDRGYPKDREYFFNILNSIFPHSIEKMVFDAVQRRRKEKDIKDEIKLLPEFHDVFTSDYSLLGNQGKTIQKLRIDHKKPKRRYNGKRKFNLALSLKK